MVLCGTWCVPCHHLENDIRNQAGAAAALEANFVPVKINFDYYPNTAKQYGVTRLPTTVILVPNAQGEVLAVIPEYMPADQYLARLNKVAADAKKRNTAVAALIQAGPPVGTPDALGQPPVVGPPPPVNPVRPIQVVAGLRPPASAVPNPAPPATLPAGTTAPAGPAGPAVAPPAASAAAANSTVAMTPPPGPSGGRPLDPQKTAVSVRPLSGLVFGLDGFCPVQLVENARWQAGQEGLGR